MLTEKQLLVITNYHEIILSVIFFNSNNVITEEKRGERKRNKYLDTFVQKVKTEDLKGSCIHEGYITATELCASVGHKSEEIRGDFNGRSDFYPPFE